MESVRISIIVLIVTILSTVYGLPIWNASKGAPPTFVKPSILPASFGRSTLSQELLNILKQSRSNSIIPSHQLNPSCSLPLTNLSPETAISVSPSNPSVLQTSAILEKLLTSYDTQNSYSCASPAPMLNKIESKNDLLPGTSTPIFTETSDSDSSNSPVPDQPSCDSQIGRPPNYNPQDAATSVSDSNLNSTPVLASFTIPCETPSPEPTPTLAVTCSPEPSCPSPLSATPPSESPFPGSRLLQIQPLNLPQKFNKELVDLLSGMQTSSQESNQNSSADTTLHPTLAPISKTPPQISSSSPTSPSTSNVSCPSKVSQLLPTTSNQPSCQLLKLLLNSPSVVNQLKSLLGYSAPSSNSISEPTASSPTPSSTSNCCLNPSFFKYLSTLPRYRLNNQ